MKHFNVEQHGPIQAWSINNPPMNYMTAPLCRELIDLVGKAEHDDETRVIVITGGVAGKFITHYSVEELAAAAADPAECARRFPAIQAGFHRLMDRIMMLNQAVIAAINGDCMGGGYELALACDFRIAAEGPFQIGLPEAVLGLLPGGGGTQRLPRLIGRARALEVMLLGNVYAPREAERLGLVNRVVPSGNLIPFAMQWARALASRPPRSVAAIKRAVYLGADKELEAGLYIERMEMRDVMCTEDARTVMRAYNEAAAKDPMEARTNFLRGIGAPVAKGR